MGNIDTELQALREENERLRHELERHRNAVSSVMASSEINMHAFYIIQDLCNKINDMSLLLSADGDVLFANEQFLRLYRLTRERLKGKVYDPSHNIITKEHFEELVESARANGGMTLYNKTHRWPDGHELTTQVSLIIQTMGGVEVIWFFFKDNTELVKSRNELRELNYLLDSIIDNLPVYLFVKDVDNELRYLYWNKAFAEYSKIPASKVIGNTDFEVFPDYSDAQKFRNDDLEVISTGEPINRHETYETADGVTRIVQTYKTLVRREDRGPLLIGVSMDITNLANIEHELIQERMRAEKADRLKTRFLANMSHEIRTPLNAIVGFSSLLADTDDMETRKQFSDIISQNSDVLLQLINDVLDLSKIEAGTLEYSRAPMDLLDMCRKIYEVHKSRTQPGVTLYFDNSDYPGTFILNEDRNRISQVVTNLLNNASKFTKEGEIHFGFHVVGDWVEMYVKDTGLGIAPDKIDAVFERFVKLNQFVQGTGLGLSICKLIVETLGGQIKVDSELGKGSTFKFTIPYKEDRRLNGGTPKASANNDKAFDVMAAGGKNERTILVAEDETSNYLYVKALIKKRYNILWAHDGQEAVKMFRQYSPDLILMDIRMPNMDGLEATKLIRTHSSNVPIVALTANAFDSDRKKALDAGMNDYMSKPIDRAYFESILEKYLSEQA